MFWSGRQLEQTPFHGAAAHFIRRQIHLGRLQPDERLPAERALSETLGISRVTLREAIGVLEEGDYVVSRRGAKGGTFVAPHSILDEVARRHLTRDPGGAWRMLEYLQATFLAALDYACDRRSPANLSTLSEIARKLDGGDSGAKLREARFEFFAEVGLASSNHNFEEAITVALDALFHPIPDGRLAQSREVMGKAVSEAHDALKMRDRSAARNVGVAVLEDIGRALNDAMVASSRT